MKRARLIGLIGVLTGTLDGIAAIISHYVKGGNNPENIFKFIASGIFGKIAFTTNGNVEVSMITTGIVFHYLIATIWTLLFFIIYPKLNLSANKYLVGLVYGVIIWVAMNYLVMPLSNAPQINRTLINSAIGIGIIALTVGLPISFLYKYNVNN